ncbi:hypothetical protein PIROE2DRAFT_1605 [Piromyces sp. E2]|nr:hypothetical protein PIROE2DRAFT_1605 [Piromyces sp. E2]|eukprot:OUM70202.1 hypothetical protein PIROE2DRAFT_1605 [Piromyces sp. E2]
MGLNNSYSEIDNNNNSVSVNENLSLFYLISFLVENALNNRNKTEWEILCKYQLKSAHSTNEIKESKEALKYSKL